MKKIFKYFKFIVIFSVLFFVISLCSIIYFGQSSKPQKSDCIIVLGCSVYGTTPSPFLKYRLDHAIELFKDGYSRTIIVSGGRGRGEDISEAQAMKKYLEGKGIDSANIKEEDKSVTTMENIKNSREIMKNNELKTALIVTNKYHLKRAELIANHYKVMASYSGVFVSEYKYDELFGYLREVPALIKFYLQLIY